MSDTPGRLLALLSLLQTPREWPGSELAERLEVSPRTIRRDIDRLRDLGYPVEATLGAAGGYRLVAGTAMPPLLLDDEEAVAVVVGLRTAAANPVAGIEEASVRALAKLGQVLPARLRRRVATLEAATETLADEAEPRVDPEALATLAAAIANRERVRFVYRAADRRESRREVEPHRLVAAWRRWYLVAWDAARDDWRVFRLDRIARPAPVGGRVTARVLPAEDAASFVLERFQQQAPAYRARAILHAPAADVAARLADTGDAVEPIDEQTCRLRTGLDTVEWLAVRLLTLGVDFEVQEPPELVACLREMGERAARAAEGGDRG